jgi:hypothetical protein
MDHRLKPPATFLSILRSGDFIYIGGRDLLKKDLDLSETYPSHPDATCRPDLGT